MSKVASTGGQGEAQRRASSSHSAYSSGASSSGVAWSAVSSESEDEKKPAARMETSELWGMLNLAAQKMNVAFGEIDRNRLAAGQGKKGKGFGKGVGKRRRSSIGVLEAASLAAKQVKNAKKDDVAALAKEIERLERENQALRVKIPVEKPSLPRSVEPSPENSEAPRKPQVKEVHFAADNRGTRLTSSFADNDPDDDSDDDDDEDEDESFFFDGGDHCRGEMADMAGRRSRERSSLVGTFDKDWSAPSKGRSSLVAAYVAEDWSKEELPMKPSQSFNGDLEFPVALPGSSSSSTALVESGGGMQEDARQALQRAMGMLPNEDQRSLLEQFLRYESEIKYLRSVIEAYEDISMGQDASS